jgi:hypothetical protein
VAPAWALALLAAVELPQGLVSDGARLIETQPEQLHGANEALPSAVATGLETRHLLAGNLCLRAMIEVVLDLAQAGYTHTLGQLDSCRRLASATTTGAAFRHTTPTPENCCPPTDSSWAS